MCAFTSNAESCQQLELPSCIVYFAQFFGFRSAVGTAVRLSVKDSDESAHAGVGPAAGELQHTTDPKSRFFTLGDRCAWQRQCDGRFGDRRQARRARVQRDLPRIHDAHPVQVRGWCHAQLQHVTHTLSLGRRPSAAYTRIANAAAASTSLRLCWRHASPLTASRTFFFCREQPASLSLVCAATRSSRRRSMCMLSARSAQLLKARRSPFTSTPSSPSWSTTCTA